MISDPIHIPQEVCADLDRAQKLEWLETNGLGGFASGTISGMNTRRYHGLLCAALKPPVERYVLLSKLEETLVVGDVRYDLSTNRYPCAVHPRGFLLQQEFRLDAFPAFVFEAGGVRVEKRIFMVHGENTTVVEYVVHPPPGGAADTCRLEVRPLIAFRDFHATTHRNDALNGAYESAPGLLTLTPYCDLPSLFIAHNAGSVDRAGHWYNNLEYWVEQERGLDFSEDLFNPAVLAFDLRAGSHAVVIASTQRHSAAESARLMRSELERRAAVVSRAPSQEPIVKRLVEAADQFIVARGDLSTVIAGYPWFSDWGRDTMIALPGLTLTTGRPEIARQVLLAFAQSVDRGMLPNRFPDHGEEPEYNTVDATLWFFEAVRAFADTTGDFQFVRDRLYPTLRQIIDAHLTGTRYHIQAEGDGLLHCGEQGVQLTWMDAKVGDWVVTPRTGKPVEIQALWYNALCIMRDLASRFHEESDELFLEQMAQLCRLSFNQQFWNETDGCLYDVIGAEGKDDSLRPNQILAVSLHHSMLEGGRARLVVEIVRRHLLTPLGLRTLAPGHPAYRSRYAGGVWDRDSAYHQGTVWPWLLGPFITAYVRVNGGSTESRQQARQWLEAMDEHLRDACLGQVSEIADADSPQEPRGCVAQAWSVAEILRAAVEDVFTANDSAPLKLTVGAGA